jgi:transcription antitermination factor NusB
MKRTVAREIAVHMVFAMGFGGRDAEETIAHHLTKEQFACFVPDEVQEALEEEFTEERTSIYLEFPDKKQEEYIRSVVTGVYEHFAELDSYISKYAIGWSFHRIPRVTAAIMRVAMYEILYRSDIPNGAAINDAVELSKSYEDEELTKFINGILGSFVRGEQIPEKGIQEIDDADDTGV